jgi:hypothetical protein
MDWQLSESPIFKWRWMATYFFHETRGKFPLCRSLKIGAILGSRKSGLEQNEDSD